MNIVGKLTIRDSVQDGPTFSELDWATAVKTLTLAGTTYVYASARLDDGIQILKLAPDGTLTAVGTFEDSAGTFMKQPTHLDVVESGGNFFLVVPGASEDGLTTLKLPPRVLIRVN